MNMNSQVALGIAASACIVIFWLLRGRKTLATFGLVAVGVVIIMAAVTHWNAIVAPLGLAPAAPTAGVSVPVHATGVHGKHVLPSHQPGVHPTVSIHLSTPVPQSIAAPPPLSVSWTQEIANVAELVCGIGISAAIVSLIVLLSFVRHRHRTFHESLTSRLPRCPECGQESERQLAEYRWSDGVGRFTGKLCADCAGRLTATAVFGKERRT